MARHRILDQRGVDALFGLGIAEDPASAEARPYDFLRPARLEREARRALDGVHHAFIESLVKSLSLLLKTPVELESMGSENVSFIELATSLGDPAATWTFSAGRAIGLVDFEVEAGLAMVDRLLGGPDQTGTAGRRLTAIEQGILRRPAERVLAALEAAWGDRLAVGDSLLAFSSRPAQSRVAGPEDRFLTTLFRIRAGKTEGTVTVALPYVAVEEALDQDTGKAPVPAAETKPAVDPGAIFASDLKTARVAVKVRLPAFGLAVRDLSNLDAGQVLDTLHGPEAPVVILVNGRPLFRGAVGSVRGRVGIRIVDTVEPSAPRGPVALKQGRVL